MLKEVIKLIFGSIENDVNKVLDLEKSIQDNKQKAIELSQEFSPIIQKLERNSRTMNVYCKLQKSESDREDTLITLRRIDEKLENAKSEYYKEIGELRKSNSKSEEKLDKLLSNEKVKDFYEEVKKREKIEKSILTILNGYLDNKVSDDILEKAVKKDDKVAKVMREFKTGVLKDSHGNKVSDKDQALTIAMSEAGLKKSEDSDIDKYEKGCLMLLTPIDGWDNIVNEIDKKDIYNEDGFGLEDEPHITVLYGFDLDKVSVKDVKDKLGNLEDVDFKIKDVSLFESNDYDVLKFDIESKDLVDLNKKVSKLPYESNFPDYNPHMTIAYLKKGKGKKYLDEFKDFIGKDLTFNKYKYSYNNEEGKTYDIFDTNKENYTNYTEEQLEEMIDEHERLIGILEPLAEKNDKVKKELATQKKELEDYKKELEALNKSELNIFEEFEPDIYKSDDGYLLDPDYMEKSNGKDISKLKKKVITVTRGGKTFQQTVYVSIDDDKKEEKTPIGEEVSPEIKGLNIIQYSDKAIAIKGDTYANVDLMRKIKDTIGVGSFNRKLKAWLFPAKYKETILGTIYSDVKDSGDDEKAEAIKNQKNSLDVGTEVSIGDVKGTIQESTSDSDGIKYTIKTEDGTTLENVNEKTISTNPETNDKKIRETLNNANESNRAKTEKKLYGIKPIEDIHKYSLKEYLSMNGLPDEDIQKVISSFKKKETKNEAQKRASTGGAKKEYTGNKIDNLTKRQLISKLVYAHYQAVKKAIENGQELKPEVLELYAELKEKYSTKRKELTEEHKRKIAEALRKNKVPEEENKKVENISNEKINETKNSFKTVDNKEAKKWQAELADLIVEKDKLEKDKYALYDKSRDIDDYAGKLETQDKARALNPRIDKLGKDIRLYKNIVQALSNGGKLISITDKVGVKYDNVPDFTNIGSENIMYGIDDILTTDKPDYIPDINEEAFERGGFIFDTIRVSDDEYLLATNKYSEFSKIKDGYRIKEGGYDPEDGGFIKLTLDQLVLTQDYYTTKKKAQMRKEADERNQRSEESWDKMPDSRKETYLMQPGIYNSIPAKLKKQIPRSKWDSMSWQEREKYYKPIKKYGVKRLKSKFDDRHMASSFHNMYERFIDPKAMSHTKDGNPIKRGEKTYKTAYAHPDAWKSWESFREMLDWKINDIHVQREEIGDIRSKAIETSYGMSNVNNALKKEYGVLVKRQNGDDIDANEIEQIKGAWEDVQQTFGKLKDSAEKDNLKLSHAGETYMFASKSIGIYVPSMKTIGVTAKLGGDQLGFTMGHEVAHWIDNTLGHKSGKRFSSDNYESTAGKIAIEFKRNMNKSTNSKYLNATHECFARAIEQHHAIQTQGIDALSAGSDPYVNSDSYVSHDIYTNKIKPLIERFLNENKEILKSLNIDLFNSEEKENDIEKARSGKYADNAENRRLKRVGQPYGSKGKEDSPNGGKTAKEDDSKEQPKGLVEEQAKNASGSALETAAKEASDPEVRSAAHKELDRRSKEEAVQEDESGEKPTKDGEKKDSGGEKQQEETTNVKEEPNAEYDSKKNKFKKALLDKEKELINKNNNKYESLSFLNKDGEEILTLDGDKDKITIPDDKIPDIINAEIATHNHPSSKGFSIADIAISLSKNIKEMRAISPNSMLGDGVWVFKNRFNFTEDSFSNISNFLNYELNNQDSEIRDIFNNFINEDNVLTDDEKIYRAETLHGIAVILTSPYFKKNKDKFDMYFESSNGNKVSTEDLVKKMGVEL